MSIFLYEDFWKMTFWLVLKLEISYYRVIIISWRILVSFRGFFWRLYFFLVKYLSFYNSSFALRHLLFHVNGKAIVWHTPCFIWLFLKMFFHILKNFHMIVIADKYLTLWEKNQLLFLFFLHVSSNFQLANIIIKMVPTLELLGFATFKPLWPGIACTSVTKCSKSRPPVFSIGLSTRPKTHGSLSLCIQRIMN